MKQVTMKEPVGGCMKILPACHMTGRYFATTAAAAADDDDDNDDNNNNAQYWQKNST